MSFRDELNSIRPDMRMLSEQEVYYEKILYATYKDIKEKIKEDAKVKVYGNRLTGKTKCNLDRCIFCLSPEEYNRVEVKDSSLYKIDGSSISLNGKMTKHVIKKRLFSTYANACVSLTDIGKKGIKDLKEIARTDDITFSFYPYLSGTEDMEVELSGFDIFEKINLADAIYTTGGSPDLKWMHSGINVHYEIEL